MQASPGLLLAPDECSGRAAPLGTGVTVVIQAGQQCQAAVHKRNQVDKFKSEDSSVLKWFFSSLFKKYSARIVFEQMLLHIF